MVSTRWVPYYQQPKGNYVDVSMFKVSDLVLEFLEAKSGVPGSGNHVYIECAICRVLLNTRGAREKHAVFAWEASCVCVRSTLCLGTQQTMLSLIRNVAQPNNYYLTWENIQNMYKQFTHEMNTIPAQATLGFFNIPLKISAKIAILDIYSLKYTIK
jgi:hypothetical protein